jgi:RNA polymerase sigma factor (sigma-70 family)
MQLARRAAAGDLPAFAELVRKYEPRLRGLLRRLAGDAGDDLAQEAFLSAWRAAGSWRGDSSYFTWLARIGWRQFLSHQRRAKRAEPLCAAAEIAVQPEDRRAAIDQALARLPERERMAALLCFAEGHTHVEAATIMEMPLGTLKSLVARARKRLVECLEDEQ